jgi:putative lipoprotein
MSRFQILKSGVAAMLMVVIAAACAGKKAPDPTGTVSGTIEYGPDVQLSPDAVAYVRLADTTKGDVDGKTVVQKEIRDLAQPIQYELTYKEKHINPMHQYAVDVRVVDKGKLMLISPPKQSVITQGSPQTLDMKLTPARGF